MKNKKLIIVGDSSFAQIAYEYFEYDSEYQVVAFSVEKSFLKQTELFSLPVVPFESLQDQFDVSCHDVYVATVYSQLNRLRTRLASEAKKKGYKLASYISSSAFVWKNVQVGEHCFIFEDNTVQPFVKLGDNVVLWSGNHIGHHSEIGDNCFVSSHVVISGHCNIGDNTFLGVNATLANNVNIGRDNWLAPRVSILKDTNDGALFKADQSEPAKIDTYRFFRVNK